MQLFSWPWAMSFLSLVLLAGCGGNPADYPETAPVTGTVTLDGAPLEGASINFVPATGRSSSGKTDAQGRYELHYTGTIEGAMLGPHRVMIWKEVPDPDYVLSEAERKAMEEGEFFLPLVHALPKRYRGQDSRLSAEVKDTNNVIDFALTSQ